MRLGVLWPAIVSGYLVLTLIAEQDTSAPATPTSANTRASVSLGKESVRLPLGQVVRLSEVIGLEVVNLQNQRLGKVNDLALDWNSARIVEVIVAKGGVLGVGQTMFCVPPGALHYGLKGKMRRVNRSQGDAFGRGMEFQVVHAKVLQLNRTQESLKGVPPFELGQWATHFKPTNVVAVYREYGLQPYFHPQAVAKDNPLEVEREVSKN